MFKSLKTLVIWILKVTIVIGIFLLSHYYTITIPAILSCLSVWMIYNHYVVNKSIKLFEEQFKKKDEQISKIHKDQDVIIIFCNKLKLRIDQLLRFNRRGHGKETQKNTNSKV